MQYSKRADLVFLKITGISQEDLVELRVFLRRSKIAKIAGVSVYVDWKGRARYSGVFSSDDAREIEEWLTERGVRPKS